MKRTVFGLALIGLAGVSQALIWDAAADFSVSSNPSGVWSYGAMEGTSFVTSVSAFTGSPFRGWLHTNNQPTVMQNVSAVSSFGILPGHLSLECDWNAPVLRFTAPTAGAYDVWLQVGGSTEWQNGGFGNNWVAYAELRVNGVSVIEDSFAGNVKTWTRTGVTLFAGDTLDAGMSNHYGGGNTDAMMIVAGVPEPATLGVVGLGLAMLARRRRR